MTCLFGNRGQCFEALSHGSIFTGTFQKLIEVTSVAVFSCISLLLLIDNVISIYLQLIFQLIFFKWTCANKIVKQAFIALAPVVECITSIFGTAFRFDREYTDATRPVLSTHKLIREFKSTLAASTYEKTFN